MGSAVGCRGAYLWWCKGLGVLNRKNKRARADDVHTLMLPSVLCSTHDAGSSTDFTSTAAAGQKYAVFPSRLS